MRDDIDQIARLMGGSLDSHHDCEQGCTQLRDCAAQGCDHNVDGHCSLQCVSINERGGCDDYEASADDYQDSGDGADQEIITSISRAMPDELGSGELPQDRGAIYNPGAMF